MSKRTFIFCDACNPQGIRTEEESSLYSRRVGDSRSWYEGEEEETLNLGWIKTDDGLNLCPVCQRNGLGSHVTHKKRELSTTSNVTSLNIKTRDA